MKYRLSFLITWGLLLLSGAAAVHAGGFRLEGSSPEVIGSSGAMTARSGGAMALFSNPANLGNLKNLKGEVAIGGSSILQKGYYSNRGQSTWGSDVTTDVVPYGAVMYSLGERLVLAAGMSRTYNHAMEWTDPSFVARYSGTGQEMSVDELAFGLSYKLNSKWSAGITLRQGQADFTYSVSRLRPVYGNGPTPELFYDYSHSFKADDSGTGFGLGVYYSPRFGMKFGFTYFSKMDFDFSGTHYVAVADLSDPRIQADFSSFSYENAMNTKWSIPDRMTIAGSFRTTVRTRVEFDLGYEDWSVNKGISLLSTDDQGAPVQFTLGDSWDKVLDFSTGAEFRQTKNLVWKAGLGYRLHVLPQEELYPGFPLYDRFAASGGLAVTFGNNVVEFSYAYNQYRDVHVANQEYDINLYDPDFLSSNSQEGLFESQKHIFALGYRRRF